MPRALAPPRVAFSSTIFSEFFLMNLFECRYKNLISSKKFIEMVLEVKPDQVTLVPDKENVLTSLEGWDTLKEKNILKSVIRELKEHHIRTSIFVNPEIQMVEGAKSVNADRIELFTGLYAHDNNTISKYIDCSKCAKSIDLGINAGHDLDLKNLLFFRKKIPFLDEVSIGHALISESLFLGLENTINMYKRILA